MAQGGIAPVAPKDHKVKMDDNVAIEIRRATLQDDLPSKDVDRTPRNPAIRWHTHLRSFGQYRPTHRGVLAGRNNVAGIERGMITCWRGGLWVDHFAPPTIFHCADYCACSKPDPPTPAPPPAPEFDAGFCPQIHFHGKHFVHDPSA